MIWWLMPFIGCCACGAGIFFLFFFPVGTQLCERVVVIMESGGRMVGRGRGRKQGTTVEGAIGFVVLLTFLVVVFVVIIRATIGR